MACAFEHGGRDGGTVQPLTWLFPMFTRRQQRPIGPDWSRGIQPQVSGKLPTVSYNTDTLLFSALSALAAVGYGSLFIVPREAVGRV